MPCRKLPIQQTQWDSSGSLNRCSASLKSPRRKLVTLRQAAQTAAHPHRTVQSARTEFRNTIRAPQAGPPSSPAPRHGCAFRFKNCATTLPRISEAELRVRAVLGIQRLPMTECSLHVMQPSAGLGQLFQSPPIQRRLHRAAIRVAAEDRVLHFQHFNRVLDRRCAAVHIVCRSPAPRFPHSA